jgi:hypothetical protein
VGVEPTTLAAKDRINGFEGHEDHRTLFASVIIANARGFARVVTSRCARAELTKTTGEGLYVESNRNVPTMGSDWILDQMGGLSRRCPRAEA